MITTYDWINNTAEDLEAEILQIIDKAFHNQFSFSRLYNLCSTSRTLCLSCLKYGLLNSWYDIINNNIKEIDWNNVDSSFTILSVYMYSLGNSINKIKNLMPPVLSGNY